MAYTPGSLLVRAVMTASTGLPADAVVNDFAFEVGSAPTSTTWTDVFSWVDNFYRATQDNGLIVSSFISNFISRSVTHELQGYVITGAGTGSPDATMAWLGPVTTSNANAMPTEVAGVLSFHADLTGVPEESGAARPRARRRGRVYIGPLNQDAIVANTPPYMLSTSFLTTLRQAAIELKDQSTDLWSVWSRQDATLRPVYAGWTDNAPDTQRRRGPASTARVVWGP